MEGRTHVLRAFGAILFTIMLALGCVRAADASNARVRWRPVFDDRVVGYHLYVRTARRPYGAPMNVGMPATAADGTMSIAIGGLVPTRTYHVAVAAYTAQGAESPLSDELPLGVLESCVSDECTSTTSCDFAPIEDGTWCTRDGGGDPCEAIGTCEQGQCVASTGGPGQLDAGRVRFGTRDSDGYVIARGRLAPAPGFDPRVSGAVFEISDASGALLYRAALSGDAFTSANAGSAYRYRSALGSADANGLRALSMVRSRERYAVTVIARSVDLRPAADQPSVRVTLRLGETCARALDLECRRVSRSGAVCR